MDVFVVVGWAVEAVVVVVVVVVGVVVVVVVVVSHRVQPASHTPLGSTHNRRTPKACLQLSVPVVESLVHVAEQMDRLWLLLWS